MQIDFYRNKSDTRQVGKTLEQTKTVTAEIYDMTDFISPIFIIAYDADILHSNYCYVPEFGKYFFIDDFSLSPGNRILCKMKTDVLETYKNEIRGMKCVVTRQENAGLSMLPDTNILVKNYNIIENNNFPEKFDFSFGSYVMQILGG